MLESDLGRARPLLAQQPIDAGELHEADRDVPVLALQPASENVLAQVPAEGHADIDAGEVERLPARRPRLHLGCPAQEPSALQRGGRAPPPGGGQRRGGAVADDDLPRPGHLLHLRECGHGGTGDDQVAMVVVPEEEEIADAAVDADRHPQTQRAAARAQAPRRTHDPLHLIRGAASPRRVLGTLEEQQRRVATPLDQPGAVFVGGREQGLERDVDQLGHLLGADLAPRAEHLGHPGEAGDVREDERAVVHAMTFLGPVPQPLEDERRHIRAEQLVVVTEDT